MKKTEKIEIRLSPEEKDRLAKQAEFEGRPVSELVRSLMTNEGGDDSAEQRRVESNPLRRFGAVALSFVGGAAMTLALTAAHPVGQKIEGWDVSLQLVGTVPTGDEHSSFRSARTAGDFRISAEDGSTGMLVLDRGQGGAYEVRGTTTRFANQQVMLDFSVCVRVSEEVCEVVASPSVTTYPREHLSIALDDVDGRRFDLDLKAVENEGR